MDDELYHYGIKGMKWGVRRYQNEDGSLTSAGKKRAANPNTSIRNQRKSDLKNYRTLSDAELDAQIKRLKTEKQFRELTEADVHPGRTAVKRFISSTGGKVVSSAAIGSLAYAGKHFVSTSFDARDLANYMFPNPNKKK